MPDYTEIKEAQARKSNEKRTGPSDAEWAAHLKIQHTISMRLEDLVKGDDWATYLSHLKALLDDDKRELDTLKERMLETTCVGDDVDKVRMAIQYFRGRILAREQDIGLPNTLIERNTEMQEKQKVVDTAQTV